MKQIMIVALAVLMLTACGNKTNSGSWTSSDSTAATASDKHSAEYITQRLNAIYQLCVDSLCCSQHYLALAAEADKISQRDGTVYLDANHWVMGQDAPEDWSYSIMEIKDITDSTATATMLIHSFADQEVKLDLVFERDNWFVDNFRTQYEGAEYDAGGNKIPGSDGIKEFNELKTIQEYIEQKPQDEVSDVPDLGNIPRRNSLEEAEEMAEKAKQRLDDYAE